MNTIIGLRDLRENVAEYAALVAKGKSFVVVRQSKPLFKISPLDEDDGNWEEAVDFTKIKKGGVKIQDLLARL
jgi:antitoxin (DNA-binding transcriptional repressor) of toxin-antitoxin stability system